MTRLKFLREEAGILQKEIAERLHVTQSAVSAWELGKFTPDIDSLYTLADLYDSSLDYMLGYSANRKIDAGKPERLLLEYLRAQHDFQPDAGQGQAIATVIGAVVGAIRLKK